MEEDAFSIVDRKEFDYIIGSSHYFRVNGEYYALDYSYEAFKKCLELFNNDVIKLAETYYFDFCKYINTRVPDIIGHFDVITKFDEIDTQRFLNNSEYWEIAKKYAK